VLAVTPEQVDVLIIGAGPAGLTAAAALAADARVLVLEREAAAGGIPRHSAHLGFGLRDVRRAESGPAYARRLVALAERAGAVIRVDTMVTDWAGERRVEITSPRGRTVVEADAIVLATGARERPRAARMVAGDRPAGVYTTGQLQNLVHLQHERVEGRAVIVGAESVSWSAALTLRHAGARPVLMTTEFASPPAYAAITQLGRAALRVPVSTSTRVTRIVGRDRVTAVEIDQAGVRRLIDCESVVFTADWIPDHELARRCGLDLDPNTLGPLVDFGLRASRPGVFAAGNLIHPVDTADWAALDGRHVALAVRDWLRHGTVTSNATRLRPGAGLRWITPGRAGSGRPPRRLSAWAEAAVRFPVITVEQDGRVVAQRRLAWPAAPGRVTRIPSSLVAALDPAGGDATVHLRAGLHTRV
jgi:thioredoxin reductase